LPPVADPEDTRIEPDAPELVVPDENTRLPLTPDVPAFSVFTRTQPEEVAVPTPVDIDTLPPVLAELPPEFM
jgi:hypothetical protein